MGTRETPTGRQGNSTRTCTQDFPCIPSFAALMDTLCASGTYKQGRAVLHRLSTPRAGHSRLAAHLHYNMGGQQSPRGMGVNARAHCFWSRGRVSGAPGGTWRAPCPCSWWAFVVITTTTSTDAKDAAIVGKHQPKCALCLTCQPPYSVCQLSACAPSDNQRSERHPTCADPLVLCCQQEHCEQTSIQQALPASWPCGCVVVRPPGRQNAGRAAHAEQRVGRQEDLLVARVKACRVTEA